MVEKDGFFLNIFLIEIYFELIENIFIIYMEEKALQSSTNLEVIGDNGIIFELDTLKNDQIINL